MKVILRKLIYFFLRSACFLLFDSKPSARDLASFALLISSLKVVVGSAIGNTFSSDFGLYISFLLRSSSSLRCAFLAAIELSRCGCGSPSTSATSDTGFF